MCDKNLAMVRGETLIGYSYHHSKHMPTNQHLLFKNISNVAIFQQANKIFSIETRSYSCSTLLSYSKP